MLSTATPVASSIAIQYLMKSLAISFFRFEFTTAASMKQVALSVI